MLNTLPTQTAPSLGLLCNNYGLHPAHPTKGLGTLIASQGVVLGRRQSPLVKPNLPQQPWLCTGAVWQSNRFPTQANNSVSFSVAVAGP